jgi:hypothetical protein
MKWMELTTKTGAKVLVNLENVCDITDGKDGCCICYGSEDMETVIVTETYERVKQLLQTIVGGIYQV